MDKADCTTESGTGDRKVSNPDFHSLVTLTEVDGATRCTRLRETSAREVLAVGCFSKEKGRPLFVGRSSDIESNFKDLQSLFCYTGGTSALRNIVCC